MYVCMYVKAPSSPTPYLYLYENIQQKQATTREPTYEKKRC